GRLAEVVDRARASRRGGGARRRTLAPQLRQAAARASSRPAEPSEGGLTSAREGPRSDLAVRSRRYARAVPTTSTLLACAGATWVLMAIPGPAVFYVLARSASQGTRAGLVSVAGLHTGSLVHIAAAVLGLSAVLVASAAAFTAVKFLGAAYLVWLGVKLLLEHRRAPEAAAPGEPTHLEPRSMRRVFTEGVIVEVLNPK